jgi:Uma2 family endonuclease
MVAATPQLAPHPHRFAWDPDNRVLLHGISWALLEQILEARGDAAGVRITYLDGDLELMSPSRSHETIKKAIARLVEAYADELGIEFNGAGSWTLHKKKKKRAVEPDECYVLGPLGRRTAPDLAIEVVWTHGGLDKLDVYRGLGVREVWVWQEGRISVHLLRAGGYTQMPRSEALPALDLDLVARLAIGDSQTAAVRALRATLRRRPR